MQEAQGLARLLPLVMSLHLKVGTAEFSGHVAILLARLRHMYFLETGTLGFLRVAASGQPAPDEDRRRLRAEHGGFDADVERAADAVRFAARRQDLQIGMEAMALLEEMIEDRTCIRESILGMLSSYGGPQVDAKGRQDDAVFILEQLEPLAPRFTEAEERLRLHVAERRPAPWSTDAGAG